MVLHYGETYISSKYARPAVHTTFLFTHYSRIYYLKSKVLYLNYLGLCMFSVPLPYVFCKVSSYLFSCLGLNKFLIHFK